MEGILSFIREVSIENISFLEGAGKNEGFLSWSFRCKN